MTTLTTFLDSDIPQGPVQGNAAAGRSGVHPSDPGMGGGSCYGRRRHNCEKGRSRLRETSHQACNPQPCKDMCCTRCAPSTPGVVARLSATYGFPDGTVISAASSCCISVNRVRMPSSCVVVSAPKVPLPSLVIMPASCSIRVLRWRVWSDVMGPALIRSAIGCMRLPIGCSTGSSCCRAPLLWLMPSCIPIPCLRPWASVLPGNEARTTSRVPITISRRCIILLLCKEGHSHRTRRACPRRSRGGSSDAQREAHRGAAPHALDVSRAVLVDPRAIAGLPKVLCGNLCRLILDSRVVIGQVCGNRLFLQAFAEGRCCCGILGKSRLISNV